jgi:hypothetical protein
LKGKSCACTLWKDGGFKIPSIFVQQACPEEIINVLLEIFDGCYSDPPEVLMYTKKIDRDGSVLENKYGMDVIECMCCTNRTEVVHKSLVSTLRGWNMGVEMCSCVFAELSIVITTNVWREKVFDYESSGTMTLG